ncbi:hypothetical protein K2Y11_18775 [bacterium]|nr:hypothetical protein [bacterium]
MNFPPIDNSSLMLISGMLLLTFTLVRVIRRKRPDMPGNSATTETREPAPRTFVSTDHLEVKLYNTFRELNARLETKINILNELIIDADRKVMEYTALRDEIVELSKATAEGEEPAVISREGNRLRGDGQQSASRYDEIYSLADRGMTPAEISQRVDQPIGEVNLILGLRRRRKSG